MVILYLFYIIFIIIHVYTSLCSEREIYAREGLKWNMDHYPDNSVILELFDNRNWGIYALCDEQLKIPAPSDTKLATSLYAKCAQVY